MRVVEVVARVHALIDALDEGREYLVRRNLDLVPLHRSPNSSEPAAYYTDTDRLAEGGDGIRISAEDVHLLKRARRILADGGELDDTRYGLGTRTVYDTLTRQWLRAYYLDRARRHYEHLVQIDRVYRTVEHEPGLRAGFYATIRAALDDGVPVQDITHITGLTRARIYQIHHTTPEPKPV